MVEKEDYCVEDEDGLNESSHSQYKDAILGVVLEDI